MAADQAELDKQAALTMAADQAELDKQAALTMAADQAEMDKQAALTMAADQAEMDKQAALTMAADQAEMDKQAALTMAADQAEMDKQAALTMAADQAEMDKQAALTMAADQAEMDKQAALTMAADQAEMDKQAALTMAADQAEMDKQAALTMAADQAEMDKQAALTMAADQAEMDKQAALTMAADQAEMDKQAALTMAADQAEIDKQAALTMAADQAEIDKQNAVNEAVAAALGKNKADVAYTAYMAAKTMLDTTYMAYAADPSVENAKAYEMAAGAASTTADAALVAAQEGGTEAQMTAAQSAVAGADDAVLMAAKSVADANRVKGITDDALQHAMVIPGVMGHTAPEMAPFDSATNTDNYSLTITHTGDGVKVEIGDPGPTTAATDDVTVDKEPGSAPYLARGWHGSMHERTTNDRDTEDDASDDVTEKFIVYTDIDRAGEEAYSDYYSQSAAGNRVGVNGANPEGVLTLETGAEDVMAAADLGRYASPSFPIGSGRIITYRENPDDDPDTMDSERIFDGMFHGISGEYTCAPINTGLCQAFTDDDGMLAGLVGNWTFEPEEVETGDPAHMVADAIPDADYMRFGYWLQTTRPDPEEDTDDPKTTYMIQAFVGGAEEFVMNTDIEGTAEYKGRAAGVYVRKVVKSGGDIASATAGEFHAKASLTAYFGGDEVAVSNQYRLKGTVDAFQDSTTGMALAGWAVNLEGADPGSASLFGQSGSSTPEGSNAAMTRTVGDTAGSTGTWTAQFFGLNTDDAQPSGVAGEFNAHWTNGHAVGAFGAEKMAE